MILHDLRGREDDPLYQKLQASNVDRQYDFLTSIIDAAQNAEQLHLSQTILKALNFHAIVCLHAQAGQYRPCSVAVASGEQVMHQPPPHYQVASLMDDFVNTVNRQWADADPLALSTYVLWRLNWIHPFINGNGRTARAASYFVLCLKLGHVLPGTVILPELIVKYRDDYCAALNDADRGYAGGEDGFLAPLHSLMQRLVIEQLSSAPGA